MQQEDEGTAALHKHVTVISSEGFLPFFPPEASGLLLADLQHSAVQLEHDNAGSSKVLRVYDAVTNIQTLHILALLIFHKPSTKHHLHLQTLTFCFRAPPALQTRTGRLPTLRQTQRDSEQNRTTNSLAPAQEALSSVQGIYSLPTRSCNT